MLVLIHKYYIEKNSGIKDKQFMEITGWDMDRLRRAMVYLHEKRFIYLIQNIDGGFFVIKPYPDGIDIVENEGMFETTFGINLGVVNVSWKKK